MAYLSGLGGDVIGVELVEDAVKLVTVSTPTGPAAVVASDTLTGDLCEVLLSVEQHACESVREALQWSYCTRLRAAKISLLWQFLVRCCFHTSSS